MGQVRGATGASGGDASWRPALPRRGERWELAGGPAWAPAWTGGALPLVPGAPLQFSPSRTPSQLSLHQPPPPCSLTQRGERTEAPQ